MKTDNFLKNTKNRTALHHCKAALFVPDSSIQRAFDNWQIFFWTQLHLTTDPLALFAFVSGNGPIKIFLGRQAKNLNELYDNGQAWYLVVVLDIDKVEL